jgi:hypothetical protein
MNIWQQVQGEHHLTSLHLKPWRVVEAQHLLSTRHLVDSVEEHEILENLIESSKPKTPYNHNYLIFTPFRYPPLPYGSRFGTIHEPSLWYGSLELETAFAEVSFYLQKFRFDSSANLGQLTLLHTAFKTKVSCKAGICLEKPPFAEFREFISAQDSYQYSQILGSEMRQAAVQAFTFYSARTDNDRLNIGIYSPEVFKEEKNSFISNQQTWQCFACEENIEFIRTSFSNQQKYCFDTKYFSACSSNN